MSIGGAGNRPTYSSRSFQLPATDSRSQSTMGTSSRCNRAAAEACHRPPPESTACPDRVSNRTIEYAGQNAKSWSCGHDMKDGHAGSFGSPVGGVACVGVPWALGT